MPSIYLTENLINKSLGIDPWRYVGSDQYDNPEYLGSSADLRSDITRLGPENFTKTTLLHFDKIDNKELRRLESVEMKKLNVKKDPSYYNKTDIYGAGGGVKGMKHSKVFKRTDAWKESRTGSKWSDEQRAARCGGGNPMFGRKAKDSTKELWSDQRSGPNNPNAVEWDIIYPDGTVIRVKGLRGYCRENNLPFTKIYSSTGGWTSIKHGAGKGGGRKQKESK